MQADAVGEVVSFASRVEDLPSRVRGAGRSRELSHVLLKGSVPSPAAHTDNRRSSSTGLVRASRNGDGLAGRYHQLRPVATRGSVVSTWLPWVFTDGTFSSRAWLSRGATGSLTIG